MARIESLPYSQSDEHGRLFEDKGRLLRGIDSAWAEFYGHLLVSTPIGALIKAGLIETVAVDASVGDYPLVLEHRRIDFVSTWREWPSLMLRDAAIMICDLGIELIPHGCGILDIHQWNVLFDFTRPVFVDFTSIVPLDHLDLTEMAGRFRNYYVLPLTFFAMGHPHFARSIRKSPDVTEPVDEALKHPALRWFPWWYWRLQRIAASHPLEFLRRLKSRLQNIPLPLAAHEVVAGQACRCVENATREDSKAYVLLSLLSQLRPDTILDLKSSDRRCATMAERLDTKVIALDTREGAANSLYLSARSRKLRILPLVLDFTLPTPRHGRKNEYPSAAERLQSEVCLMLDLVDYLINFGLSFDRIASLLSAYTTRYAIVELAPANGGPRDPASRGLGWREVPSFLQAMSRHFRFERQLDYDPPSSMLFIFQKL